MAVFTSVSLAEVDSICQAYGLGAALDLTPIAAGSVNSNFFVRSEMGTFFFRIYEEQSVEGVRYEWALLDHLRERGIAVPRRAGRSEVVFFNDKPIGIFEELPGNELCQRMVTEPRMQALGHFLANAHRAATDFPLRRAGRFTLDDVEQRLHNIHCESDTELSRVISALMDELTQVRNTWVNDLPVGVVHGDLFRDNVRWDGDKLAGVLDWESASDGVLAYDLIVTLLAWCYDDDMRWDLARALVLSYHSHRPLNSNEQASLHTLARAACVRFATTRITDFYLRKSVGGRVYKDYRRFVNRLNEVNALSPEAFTRQLLHPQV